MKSLLAILLLAFAGAAREEPAALDARPAAVPMPQPPPAERDPGGRPPEPGEIGRDASVSDRFTAADQEVTYTFEARRGELSLFELATWGYARGWSSAARMKVLDPLGKTAADTEGEGGVAYRLFLAHTAHQDGEHRLLIEPEENFFRYVLVRHSGYAERTKSEVLEIGERELVHSYLADGSDRATFEVPLRRGQEVALKVLGTREEARREARLQNGPLERLGRGMAMGMGMTERRGRHDPDVQFPSFRLDVGRTAKVLARSPHFALVRGDSDGTARVTVTVAQGDRGGLFDLAVDRTLERHPLRGTVVDETDQPLSGVEILFLLEPDFDPIGRAATAKDGTYETLLPDGDYQVLLERSDERPPKLISAGISGGGELNLLWPARE